MSADNVINLVAAIIVGGGTLFLGIMAWRNIRLTRSIQKAEKKERLLNEIIEWAESVANSAIGRQTKAPHELWKTKLDYKKHKTKGKYVVQIINSSFPELSQFYLDIDAKLDGAILFLEDINTGKIGKEAIVGVGGKSLRDVETGIAGAVEELFKEAAKIKAKDIS